MNIQISKLTNGYIVAISSPQGNMATYVATWDEVIEQLKEIGSKPLSNISELPKNGRK